MSLQSTYFRSMFFAYNAPVGDVDPAGVVLWGRVRPDHHLQIVSELAFTQRLESELAVQVQTRDRALALGGRIAYTVANAECFAARTLPLGFLGQTIADTFGMLGVALTQADPDTFNGWQRVRNYLRPAPDGAPWLTIEPGCEQLIRGLSTGLSQDTHADELATYSPALHALRFAVMSQPSPDYVTEHEAPPPGTPAWTMRQLLNQDPSAGRRFGEAR